MNIHYTPHIVDVILFTFFIQSKDKMKLCNIKQVLLFVALTFSVKASAYDFMVDKVQYTIISTEPYLEVKVVGGTTGTLHIPAEVEYKGLNFKVRYIDGHAFENKWGSEHDIWELTIDEGVYSIGAWAFVNNYNLNKVSLPKDIIIHEYAFGGCSGLETFKFPESVSELNEGILAECANLNSVELPSGLKIIPKDLLNGCSNLNTMEIPNSVVSIGDYSLSRTGFSEINIPESVETIGRNAFAGSALKTITIPNLVTSISAYTFLSCKNLESIIIPNTITEIEGSAFYGCSNLENINLPEGITKISGSTFKDCYSLKSIVIPSKVTTIQNNAFEGCTKLESVNIPSSVKEIYSGAFYYCSNLQTINLPESLEKIGDKAFAKSGLTSICFPNSLKNIGESVFAECDDLTSVVSRMEEPCTIENENCFDNVAYLLIKLTVPPLTAEKYNESYAWHKFKNIIEKPHDENDNPIVISVQDASSEYGDKLPKFQITSEGAILDGTPEIICEATENSQVGTYDIIVKPGSVKNFNATYVNGKLTITKAPLTITAKDYTIKQGEELPTFEVTYEGFKNNETEDVLTKKPTIATTATSASEPGEYDITASDAEATNYEIGYVNGKLTIETSNIISKGVYALGSGNMATGSPSNLTYFDYNTGKATPNAFEVNNGGMSLGMTANDILKYGKKIYIVVDGEHTVFVTDANLKLLHKIDMTSADMLGEAGGVSPRRITADGPNIYVSTYGGYVAAIDTLNFSLVKKYKVGSYPEGLIVDNGYLYVANSDYGYGNASISKVDLNSGADTPITDENIRNPQEIVIAGSDIYFLDFGQYGTEPPYAQENAGVYCISGGKVTKVVADATGWAISSPNIYTYNAPYSYGDPKPVTYNIYNVQTKELESFTPSDIESPATMCIDPVENLLYIASYHMTTSEWGTFPDYTSNGYVNYYDLSTMNKIGSFDCGIGPRRIGVNLGTDYILGDANGDEQVNVTDIVATVNYIMNKPSTDFNFEAADVNCDGEVNVTDIVAMVNIIMKDGTQNAREVMSVLRRSGFIF